MEPDAAPGVIGRGEYPGESDYSLWASEFALVNAD